MKDLLKFLPQILNILPGVIKYLKYIPILMILGGLGYVGFYFLSNMKERFVCFNNDIYEQVEFNSSVYKFKGGYCISDKNIQ
jgi:hypothetical protein